MMMLIGACIVMMRKNELEMHRMIDTNTDIDTNRLS